MADIQTISAQLDMSNHILCGIIFGIGLCCGLLLIKSFFDRFR